MDINVELIKQSGKAIQRLGPRVTEYFYNHMFTHYPEVRPLFPPHMTEQQRRLFEALLFLAEHVDRTEQLVPYLNSLGVSHIQYNTRPEHYPIVGRSLLATLQHFLGPAWTREMAESWIAAYNLVATICIEAACAAMKSDRYLPLTLADAPSIALR
ncbi:MAG: globin domain-containing protein [Methylacidiphilaceae bacterium]|nr:globin domain-containing protein [Candidatus Methylacidiphilaceae bacterium]